MAKAGYDYTPPCSDLTLDPSGAIRSGALGPGRRDLGAQALQLTVIDHRADERSFLGRVAGGDGSSGCRKASDKLVVEGRLDDDAVDGHADLALVQEPAKYCRLDGGAKVSFTSEPTASTIPAPSWPSTAGSGVG